MKYKTTIMLLKILSILSVLLLVSCDKVQTVSTETLLKEMIDKRAVTYFPEYYYTTKQFSSYDRASDKGDHSDNQTWFANEDWSFFLRKDTIDERIENVMYDAAGPGAITRLWITVAGNEMDKGIIRFYIDGEKEPVLEGNAIDFIGENKEVAYPLSSALSEKAAKYSRGHNLYLPIPYSKHCKVTYENDALIKYGTKASRFYYNINYRTYEDNTVVESFTKSTLDSLQTLIKETNVALLAPEDFAEKNRTTNEIWSVSLKPDQIEATTIESENSALSEITIKLRAKDMEQALRSTILKISFDDNQTVWCPIGDFFGTGHIWRNSLTWRTKVDAKHHTLNSTWVMPFKKNCKISIENLGSQNVDIEANLTQCNYKWNDRSMYFGSSWHQYSAIASGKDKIMGVHNDGAVDLNFINLFGKGVFVGDALSIYNTAIASWWGEGDEKIYIDGETFPSHFGTGTEDYYGYAWCRPEPFSHPFVAQPIGEGNFETGYTINSRFRGLDAIPFKKSMKFDMELWHWSGAKMNYAPTTFYYMLPGGSTDREIDIKGAKEKIARDRFDAMTNDVDKDGMIKGVDLKFDKSLKSQIKVYNKSSLPYTHSLLWDRAKQGDELDVEFSVLQEGEYEVLVGVVQEPDLAMVGFKMNGKSVISSFRGDAEKLTFKEHSLGRHKLKLKDNKLSVKVIQEKNGKCVIDYIKVIK